MKNQKLCNFEKRVSRGHCNDDGDDDDDGGDDDDCRPGGL